MKRLFLMLMLFAILSFSALFGLTGYKGIVLTFNGYIDIQEKEVRLTHPIKGCYTEIAFSESVAKLAADEFITLYSSCDSTPEEIGQDFDIIISSSNSGVKSKLKNLRSVDMTFFNDFYKYVDSDAAWPDDIWHSVQDGLPEKNVVLRKYKSQVHEEINKSGVYDPILKLMKKQGCILALVDKDGAFIEYKISNGIPELLSQDDVINAGYIKSPKKSVYPAFSRITYNANCTFK